MKTPADRPDWFALSVVAVLSATGASKVATLISGARLLEINDFLLGISYKHLLFIVTPIEFALAGILLFWGSPAKYIPLAWFSSLLLTYRLISATVHPPTPCACLGSLGDWLGIDAGVASALLLGSSLYMLTGSL